MSLVESFVRNPVKVAVGVLIVALFGTVSFINMPKQLTPRVLRQVLSIETAWPGASPQEVEREIVLEQEEQLQSVEGVVKLTSTCSDSNGRILMEFVVGTDMHEALLQVSTALQQVREYPPDAREPRIRLSDSSDSPIARYFLSPIPPGADAIRAVQEAYPELREPLEPVRLTNNPGLALLRLDRLVREYGDRYPELVELQPPPVDLSKMQRFVEDNVATRLARVPGVADAYVYGGAEEELQVIVDPEQLASRQLTIAQVRDALQRQNKDTSGGEFWEEKRQYGVRILGQFRSTDDVKSQLLAVQDGQPVYVGDVAEVKLGFKKPDSFSRRYGTRSIGVGIQRTAEANVLEVMDELRIAAAEINETVLKPRGLELFQQYDETEYIHSAIGLVQQNIFIGGALTMIVLMLFLNRSSLAIIATPFIAGTALAAAYVSPWYFIATLAIIIVVGFHSARGALVVGLAIPTSIIGTFLMMGLLGRSLNVISLAGMAFAVGMLVDSAVVVLENIFRRHENGERPFVAAVRGTEEVWGAVVASTLTTIAVFLPVLFVEDVAGQLFRDIALAISCAIGLSMVISFTLIPALSARLFREQPVPSGADPGGRSSIHASGKAGSANGAGAHAGKHASTAGVASRANPLMKLLKWMGHGFINGVVGVNEWVLRGTVRSLAVITLIVGAAVGLSYIMWPDVDYLPTGNRNMIIGNMSFPPGYNVDEMMHIGDTLDEELRPYWDTMPGTPEAAALDAPVIDDYFFFGRRGSIFLGLRSADSDRVNDLIPVVRRLSEKIPGAQVRASPTSLFERGLSGGRSIDIEIAGPNLKRLVELGRRILGDVNRVMPEAQAMPQPSLDLSSPEIHVKPLLVQTAEMGLNSTDLGYTVDSLLDGAYAGDYFVGGDKVDLTIKGTEKSAQVTQDIEILPVATPSGQLVPLAALARVSLESGPEQIMRRERQRAITISVSPPAEVPLEEAMTAITEQILAPLRAEDALRGGYTIYLSGTADQLRQSWESLKWNLILALAITYLLMAALFESWLYPFVIIFTVPLGAVGGLLGLKILNLFMFQALDVLTMLGFVILIGTVVNNAILIVHQSLIHMREEGMAPDLAIPTAVRSRIRPIFITTGTTVLGLLPLVIFPGEGSELYRGLGSVVLGGLVASTMFTLVLVPTVFAITLRARSWLFGAETAGLFSHAHVDPSDAATRGFDAVGSEIDDVDSETEAEVEEEALAT
ncbi:MAG: efflux RND transporter permease subunit [Planctomycetaceae bacterium]